MDMQGMEIDQARDNAIKAEIQRLLALNPDSIASYIIINEPDESKLPEQLPIMLFHKQLKVADVVKKMHDKFKDYPHVYIFGKDHQKQSKIDLSLREKRKQKGTKTSEYEYQGQRVVHLDEEQLEYTVGYAHGRYHNNDDMLVLVVCSKPIPRNKPEPPKVKEGIFIFFAVIFVLFYLFLAYTDKENAEAVSVSLNETSIL